MSWRVILKDEIRTARKIYRCDAYRWWNDCGCCINDCTNSEERLVLEAMEANKGRIFRGQKYRYMRGVEEDMMVTLRLHIAMDELCRAHGLYDD